jgi:hypothetical protein
MQRRLLLRACWELMSRKFNKVGGEDKNHGFRGESLLKARVVIYSKSNHLLGEKC